MTELKEQGQPRKRVQIYCDGSSLGNGQIGSRAAAAAVLGYKGIWRVVGEYLGRATNQQAEIAAAAVGLESLREPCDVEVFTDSRYVVETMCGRFRKKTNPEWWKGSNVPQPNIISIGNGLAGTLDIRCKKQPTQLLVGLPRPKESRSLFCEMLLI